MSEWLQFSAMLGGLILLSGKITIYVAKKDYEDGDLLKIGGCFSLLGLSILAASIMTFLVNRHA